MQVRMAKAPDCMGTETGHDAPDNLPGARPAAPERSCIVTRQKAGENDLLRFVFSPDGEVVADLRHKLPGRGAYVSLSVTCLREAVKRNAFSRAFKRQVKANPTLPDEVEALLRQDALNHLSLANKAGLVIAGFEKLEAEGRRKPFSFCLHAADGSEAGLQKLARVPAGLRDTPIRLFDASELSHALGRENAVNIGLKKAQLSDVLLAKIVRLERYLAG